MQIGNSHLRSIIGSLFNNSFDTVKHYIKPFGDAEKDIKHYISLTLTEQKAEAMVEAISAAVKWLELYLPISTITCCRLMVTIIRISCRGCAEVLCQILDPTG